MASSKDIQLRIPSSIAEALAIPENRKQGKLQLELAVALYREGMLSFGKARELAGLDHYAFAQQLRDREIERHYGPDELDEDSAYGAE